MFDGLIRVECDGDVWVASGSQGGHPFVAEGFTEEEARTNAIRLAADKWLDRVVGKAVS